MKYLYIFGYCFFLLGCQSVNSAPDKIDKELIFKCQSDQYIVEMYQKYDDYLVAHFIDGSKEKILEGSVKRVDLLDEKNESIENTDVQFYYTYNARVQYETYDIEFRLDELSTDVYHFYDGQFEPNVNVGFWIYRGQEQYNYSCNDGYVNKLYVLNQT